MPITPNELIFIFVLSALSAAAVGTVVWFNGRTSSPIAAEVIAIIPPLGLRSDPRQFFMSLHGLLEPAWARFWHGQQHLSVEVGGSDGRVSFFIWVPTEHRRLIEDLLVAAHPGIEMRTVDDPAAVGHRRRFVVADIGLSRNTYLPIGSPDGEGLAPLLSVLSRTDLDERVHLSLLIRPKPNGWQNRARIAIDEWRTGDVPPWRRLTGPRVGHVLGRDHFRRAEQKAAELGFDCALRVAVDVSRQSGASGYLRSVSAALRPYMSANGLSVYRTSTSQRALDDFTSRRMPARTGVVLTPTELAGLWHLPQTGDHGVEVIVSPRIPVPRQVATKGVVIGRGVTRGHDRPVALAVEAKRHHVHVLGPTGTGKTTLLANMLRQDLASGVGVGLCDPKGDLFAAALAAIPRDRLEDVVVVSPDDGHVIGLNPLEWSDPDERELVAENTLSIFKRVYERFWGPRTDDVLRSCLLTLVASPNSTLAQIPILLTDASYRRTFTQHIADPIGLGGFWRWYDSLSEGQRNEAIGPVLNKLRDFLIRTRIRRLLCQSRSTIDLDDVINSGRILLADLSAGSWGDESSNLIGSFLVAKLWQAARRRGSMPEHQRRDFSLYIDEFQQFLGVSGPFGDTLAQARSFRLSLILANQHLGQIPRELRQALASNARSRIAFQVGPDDARHLAREFEPLDVRALMNIRRHEAVARVFADGGTTPVFSITTMPPHAELDLRVAQLARERSNARFARSAEDIDNELEASIRLGDPDDPPARPGRRARQ